MNNIGTYIRTYGRVSVYLFVPTLSYYMYKYKTMHSIICDNRQVKSVLYSIVEHYLFAYRFSEEKILRLILILSRVVYEKYRSRFL